MLNSRGRGYVTGARAHLYLAISESIRVLLLSEWHRIISTASVRYILKIFHFLLLGILVKNYSSIFSNLHFVLYLISINS